MVRIKNKWCICFCYLIAISGIINSLPIDRNAHKLVVSDDVLRTVNDLPKVVPDEVKKEDTLIVNVVNEVEESTTGSASVNQDVPLLRNAIRPGLTIDNYAVELTIDGGTFEGRVLFRARVTEPTRDDPLILHSAGLSIRSVRVGVTDENSAVPASFDVDDDELEIEPERFSESYIVIIEYSGNIGISSGIYSGEHNDYLAMNLHPTNARRVFPCIDELTETAPITLTVNGVPYSNLISNSLSEDNEPSVFRPLHGPPSRWGFVGHDFTSYNLPVPNVQLSGRPGLQGQENQASVAINHFFNTISEWTARSYFDMVTNQATNMHVIAFPEEATEWNTLSIVGIWEPYVFMEQTQHAVKQRQVGLVKIAEAIARPWFGYAIFPENWSFQWLTTGLTTYLAYEAVKEFQSDENLLDYETLFVTEVLQESLYRDAYRNAPILEPDDFMFDETDIRLNHHGLMNYKAPAIMSMLRLAVNRETDIVQVAARGLFITSHLQTVRTSIFMDIMLNQWPDSPVGDLEDFLLPYIKNRGCPLLTVNFQSGQATISRSNFDLAGTSGSANYHIPITFTTSVTPDFDDVFPSSIYDEPFTLNIPVNLGEDDWILFNIQGRGYYRVQYNIDMWERIIEALEDPDRRNVIHPLNRATLVDDSLNLARRIVAGLDYDIAFRIALAMEHETEYAPWKAYIRNFNFLNKRLEAMILDDEDLDPDIYLRMVRRTVVAFEDEIGFRPENNLNEPAMRTLTRGLVMDYACRAGYDSCIAAAVDWFHGGNEDVNPDIPHDIRPAVYCSVVREGDAEVRNMLIDLLDNTQRTRNMYDRLVILEALACSQDGNFIDSYLSDTISPDSPYTVEERSRIFTAVANSGYFNARRALNFITQQAPNIRQRYGGSVKLEEMLFIIAENCADGDLVSDFEAWITNNFNNLGESEDAALEALALARENMEWNNRYLEEVYDWIEENDASSTALSMLLLSFVALIHML